MVSSFQFWPISHQHTRRSLKLWGVIVNPTAERRGVAAKSTDWNVLLRVGNAKVKAARILHHLTWQKMKSKRLVDIHGTKKRGQPPLPPPSSPWIRLCGKMQDYVCVRECSQFTAKCNYIFIAFTWNIYIKEPLKMSAHWFIQCLFIQYIYFFQVGISKNFVVTVFLICKIVFTGTLWHAKLSFLKLLLYIKHTARLQISDEFRKLNANTEPLANQNWKPFSNRPISRRNNSDFV